MADVIKLTNPYTESGYPQFVEVTSPRQAGPVAPGTLGAFVPDPNPYIELVEGAEVVTVPQDVFLLPFLGTVSAASVRGNVPSTLSVELETILKTPKEVWVFTGMTPVSTAERVVNPLATLELPDISDPVEQDLARTALSAAVITVAQQSNAPNPFADRLAPRILEAAWKSFQAGKLYPGTLSPSGWQSVMAAAGEIVAGSGSEPWRIAARSAATTAGLALLDSWKGKNGGNWAQNFMAYRGALTQPASWLLRDLMRNYGITGALENLMPGLGGEVERLMPTLLEGLLNHWFKKTVTSLERVQDVVFYGLVDHLDSALDPTENPEGVSSLMERVRAEYQGVLLPNLKEVLLAMALEVNAENQKAQELIRRARKVMAGEIYTQGAGFVGRVTVASETDVKGAITRGSAQDLRYSVLADAAQTPTFMWVDAANPRTTLPFFLLPARSSGGVGRSTQQAPGVGAGLSYRTIMNMVALNIPGRGPQYQPFGIKGEMIEYVAAFIGHDPSVDVLQDLYRDPAGNQFHSMRSIGLAWDESKTAADWVRKGRKTKLVIKTHGLHIEETGWVEAMERTAARDDMVWYRVTFRVDSQKKCLDATPSARTPGYEAIQPGAAPKSLNTFKQQNVQLPSASELEKERHRRGDEWVPANIRQGRNFNTIAAVMADKVAGFETLFRNVDRAGLDVEQGVLRSNPNLLGFRSGLGKLIEQRKQQRVQIVQRLDTAIMAAYDYESKVKTNEKDRAAAGQASVQTDKIVSIVDKSNAATNKSRDRFTAAYNDYLQAMSEAQAGVGKFEMVYKTDQDLVKLLNAEREFDQNRQ